MRGKILCTVAGFVLGTLTIMLLRPAGAVRPPAPERVTEAELALERAMGEIDFENTPLDQAIATLASASGTPIVVDWVDLEPRGLNRTEPVTLRARGIPLDEALDRILLQLSAFPDGPITYSAETGKVMVGTAERIATQPVVRIYDVRDLLGPDIAPVPQPAAVPKPASGSASGGGGGLFGNAPPRTPYERRLEGLHDILETRVAP